MRNFHIAVAIALLLITGIALASCSGSPAGSLQAASPVTGVTAQAVMPTPQPDPLEGAAPGGASNPSQVAYADVWSDGQRQRDGQGAVEVEIRPLNLNQDGEMLEFEVSLNTHSIDLSMDLAELAWLTTDTGRIVPAYLWDSPSGGHHVSGILSFPAKLDGLPLLGGATKLTLTLENLDAPVRIFVWERR